MLESSQPGQEVFPKIISDICSDIEVIWAKNHQKKMMPGSVLLLFIKSSQAILSLKRYFSIKHILV